MNYTENFHAAGIGYPKSYHAAIRHLIDFGWYKGDTQRGRNLIARALREIKRLYGLEGAMFERKHMLFICGTFPEKK